MSYLRNRERKCPACGSRLVVHLDSGALSMICPNSAADGHASPTDDGSNEEAKGSNHDG